MSPLEAVALGAPGNADLPAATFLILLALAYFLTSLSFAMIAARSARAPRRPVRREPTSLCPRCKQVTWTGGRCLRCQP